MKKIIRKPLYKKEDYKRKINVRSYISLYEVMKTNSFQNIDAIIKNLNKLKKQGYSEISIETYSDTSEIDCCGTYTESIKKYKERLKTMKEYENNYYDKLEEEAKQKEIENKIKQSLEYKELQKIKKELENILKVN